MMSENVVIEPIDESCILWYCLHDGPVAIKDIGKALLASNDPNWKVLRKTNVPLLKKIIKTYGTCGLIAKADNKIVGFIRFYPKALYAMEPAGMMCLQQFHPPGPSEKFVEEQFPAFEDIKDKTLEVHCVMTSRPYASDQAVEICGGRCVNKVDAGAHKGIGLKLARALVDWARKQGWKRIEVTTFADLDIFYGTSGGAGKGFWEKAGFKVEKTRPMSRDDWPDEKAKTLIDAQAKAAGITNDQAWSFYDMTCEL